MHNNNCSFSPSFSPVPPMLLSPAVTPLVRVDATEDDDGLASLESNSSYHSSASTITTLTTLQQATASEAAEAKLRQAAEECAELRARLADTERAIDTKTAEVRGKEESRGEEKEEPKGRLVPVQTCRAALRHRAA